MYEKVDRCLRDYNFPIFDPELVPYSVARSAGNILDPEIGSTRAN